jgi:predicted NUDIX family NTP pyrophosphohydrolase
VGLLSAALLIYRRDGEGVEVFLVHPGGPYWARKDDGSWSLPKGLVNAGEDPREAAQREFQEETGFPAPEEPFIELGEVKLASGKRVRAWAAQAEVDPSAMQSNLFQMEWPPRSGLYREFPEADRGGYFGLEEARRKLHPAQVPFLERLAKAVAS